MVLTISCWRGKKWMLWRKRRLKQHHILSFFSPQQLNKTVVYIYNLWWTLSGVIGGCSTAWGEERPFKIRFLDKPTVCMPIGLNHKYFTDSKTVRSDRVWWWVCAHTARCKENLALKRDLLCQSFLHQDWTVENFHNKLLHILHFHKECNFIRALQRS